jgi:hypothetical protein
MIRGWTMCEVGLGHTGLSGIIEFAIVWVNVQ